MDDFIDARVLPRSRGLVYNPEHPYIGRAHELTCPIWSAVTGTCTCPPPKPPPPVGTPERDRLERMADAIEAKMRDLSNEGLG